uniref:THAP domain-containing protein 1 n=1 Tax=Astyanax mexicanus TaxID=7994 RepID=A0A3B1IV84_ASTMX
MTESSRRCYCSVPACSNSKQRHPYLSFHDFPKDEGLRKSWVRLIRRDEGLFFNILRGSTHVCSLHFDSADIYVSKSGRKRLKPGALPRRFTITTVRALILQVCMQLQRLVIHQYIRL